MKKIIILSSVAIIALMTIIGISCKKDILVKDNPFEVQLVYNEKSIVLNEKTKLEIEIKPEQNVTTTEYFFKYKILSGVGYFEKDGKKVDQNKVIALGDKLSFLNFTPEEVGDIELQIEFSDNKGEVSDKTITYTCDYYSSEFTFTAVAVADYSLINETVAINFNLDGPEEKSAAPNKNNNVNITERTKTLPFDKKHLKIDKSLTSNGYDKGTTAYTMRFDVQSGAGVFIYNSVEYTEGQIINVVPGVFTGKYKGTNVGTNNVTFTVTNDNETPISVSSEISIEYSYYSSDFTITAVAQQTDMLVGTTTTLDFNLTEILKEDVTYSMTFTNSLNGTFTYNGTEYNAGDVIVFQKGVSTGTYIGLTDGSHNLQITIKNSNHDPESHTAGVLMNYSYYSSDFNFTAIPDDINVWVDSTCTIEFNLTESLKKSNSLDVNYIMIFTNSSTGIFKYNGTEYNEGDQIVIVPGITSGTYVGTIAETHSLSFSCQNDNHYPVTKTSNIDIVFTHYTSDFNIVITPEETNVLVDSITSIEFNLTELLKSNVNYNMAFTNSSTGIFTYNGAEYDAGDIIVILPGVSTGTYKGTEEGTHKLQFVVRNDNENPTVKIVNVEFEITHYSSDFNIIAIPAQTSANVGDDVRIDFVLTEMLKNKTPVTYNMFFTSSGNGTFLYNGVEYYATQIFTIEPGGSFGKYTGNDAQVHNIEFTVSNSNQYPTSHSVDVSIEYVSLDYDINVTPMTGDTYPKHRDVNYMLSIDGGGDGETTLRIEEYDIDTNSQPEINDNRADFIYGSTYPVVIDGNGNETKINFLIWGEIGTNIYKLIVTKNDIVKTKEITLNILPPPFEITNITTSPSSIYPGNDITVNITNSTTYDKTISYTYELSNGSISTNKTISGTGTVSVTMPVQNTSGTQTINIIGTNQYGYQVSESIDINVLSNDFSINVDNDSQTEYPKIHGTYNFTVDGGQPGSNTYLRVKQETPHQNNDNLIINGANQGSEFDHNINITGTTNNQVKIYKSQVGTENYIIEVTKDGITKQETISLNCEVPPFNITGVTAPAEVWNDENISITTTTSSVYTKDIVYDYTFTNPNGGNGTGTKTGVGTYIKTLLVPNVEGTQTVSVEVENAYGYIQNSSVEYEAKNPNPIAQIENVEALHFLIGYIGETICDRFTFDLTGIPQKGDYCTTYRVEFWNPCANGWDYGGDLTPSKTPNTVNAGNLNTNFKHVVAEWTSETLEYDDCDDEIFKIRVRVKDNNGRLSDWVEYTKP